MARGYRRLQSAAAASSESPNAHAAVEQKLAKHQIEASAKVAKIADEALGTLIEDMA